MSDLCLRISGSAFEGGGGLIRDSLSLASTLDTCIRIDEIRANRPGSTGLRKEHTVAISTVARLCGADVEGNAQRSKTLDFRPHASQPQEVPDDILNLEVEGAAGILMIAVLPYILFSGLVARKRRSRPSIPSSGIQLNIRAGTLAIKAPSFAFLQQVFVPTLHSIGLSDNILLSPTHEQGWHTEYFSTPGLLSVWVKPLEAHLPAFTLPVRGRVAHIIVTVHAPVEYLQEARSVLDVDVRTYFGKDVSVMLHTTVSQAQGCYHVLLTAVTKEPWASLGYELMYPARDGFPPEVAHDPSKLLVYLSRACIRGLQQELLRGNSVDEHMEDMLSVYQALSDGFSSLEQVNASEAVKSICREEAFGELHLWSEEIDLND